MKENVSNLYQNNTTPFVKTFSLTFMSPYLAGKDSVISLVFELDIWSFQVLPVNFMHLW